MLLLLICGCADPAHDTPQANPATDGRSQPAEAAAIFVDATDRSGLDFVHHNGSSGHLYPPEIMGSGAALFDADNDGDLDLYLVQATHGDRLYRNTLATTGEAAVQLEPVTEAIPASTTEFGMGIATGDIDNDGRIDVYVTAFGANRMLRNTSTLDAAATSQTLRFADVTQHTGTGDHQWSVPAVFFDYDRDGWLDLYVGNYLAVSLEDNKVCRGVTGERDYCAPDAYPSAPDRLFRNRGVGTDGQVAFEDVTQQTGLDRELGATLGAIAADFNGDGWLDLYVANDRQPNHLWINQGRQEQPGRSADGTVTFRNEAQLAGCAVNAEGFSEASMGVEAADIDGDGDLDLFVTHLVGETNTLYLNDGNGIFEDRTIATGLGTPSQPMTAFGAGTLDLDLDGRLDLVTVNGAVKILEGPARQGDPFPYHQPNQIFAHRLVNGNLRFDDITQRAGEAFAVSETSRGAAFGDLDNDGDTDLVITNNQGPARLLLNQRPRPAPHQPAAWLGIRLASDRAGDVEGTRVALDREGAPTLWRVSRTSGSYASARDPRLLFGLGESAKVTRMRVYWASGDVETWTELPLNTYTTLTKGTGTAL